MCQDMLEAAQLEGSLAEKALGMLVGTKLNMSQQRVLAAKKAYWCSWLHQAKHCRQVKGGDPALLQGTGEAAAGMLCPVRSSPVQERPGTTQESPAKDPKAD